MTLNAMKPAEGIYTTGEMPKVFTPMENSRGIYTAL